MQPFYTNETGIRAPLRIGILMKSSSQPDWVRSLVRKLSQVNYLRVELIIFTPAVECKSFITKLIHEKQYLLFFLYKRIDKAWFTRRTKMSEPLHVEELVKEVPVLRMQSSYNSHTEHFSSDELQKIQLFDLDAILCLDEWLPNWQDCDLARYGLWTLEDTEKWPDSDGQAGFWEVIEHQTVTKCSLRMWSSKGDMGKVIFQSFISTNPDSVTLNRSNYFSKMSALVLRELRLLWEESGHYHRNCVSEGKGERLFLLREALDDQVPNSPTNRKLIIPLLKHCWALVKRRIDIRLFNHQWFLAFNFNDNSKDSGKLTGVYTEMIPPPDRFWADPFPVYQNGKYYLFFEELLFRSGKGHLSVTELHLDGSWTTPKVVLEQDCHLSYPFVFKWQETHYMIPETNQKKSIELYKCVEWPHKWKIENILMSGVNASDATICEIDGLWWMFVAMAVEGTQAKDELFLYYSETPMGPWVAHKRNPVVSDVRKARPAGRIFQSDGVWMRPAQDCSGIYGSAMVIMEIVRINPHEYVEKEQVRIKPLWSKNLIGTHTFNTEGSLTVIDGCRKRLKFHSISLKKKEISSNCQSNR